MHGSNTTIWIESHSEPVWPQAQCHGAVPCDIFHITALCGCQCGCLAQAETEVRLHGPGKHLGQPAIHSG